MRAFILLLVCAGCTHSSVPDLPSLNEFAAPDSADAHLTELTPSLIDTEVVLDGWVKRREKGWPTELNCVGMKVILTFSPGTSPQELDSLDGKHVHVQGVLRGRDVLASFGQQGHPERRHVRYYVEVTRYELTPETTSDK